MRKIRFVALLLALALLLCACGAAKTPLEQAAAYLKKAAPNPGYGSLNGDWTVFGLARSGVQVERLHEMVRRTAQQLLHPDFGHPRMVGKGTVLAVNARSILFQHNESR